MGAGHQDNQDGNERADNLARACTLLDKQLVEHVKMSFNTMQRDFYFKEIRKLEMKKFIYLQNYNRRFAENGHKKSHLLNEC